MPPGIVPGMLLVFGPRSTDYDFGPDHPLTPRRFGPGIDLLRAVGAEPGLAPEPAAIEDLVLCHSREYVEVVRRFSVDPFGFVGYPEAGIGLGDNPPFPDMNDAAAAVAGGSLGAMEAILRGDVEHALHPGGGLHHAMHDRAAGFCIYNDPALAIALARREGLRVMYIDLDVHHGDGVQALFYDDPGVLTFSIHESGRYLFPGTGRLDELGEGVAAGTSVNVPLEPGVGERPWLMTLESLLPELAAAFGPDVIVSQHGADSHAWDPLAHLNVTTTAHGAAARLVDAIAHRFADGRWLATGGGGYDAYRVVPRTWALTWLAGAHREVPPATPPAWRERWAAEGARYGQAPLPETFDDAGLSDLGDSWRPAEDDTAALDAGGLAGWATVPGLVRQAIRRGWWNPMSAPSGLMPDAADDLTGTPTIIPSVDATTWAQLSLAPRVVSPANPGTAHDLIAAGLLSGYPARVTAAVVGSSVVGLALSAPADPREGAMELLALGVAPSFRRRGLAGQLLADHVIPRTLATVTMAERDVFDPLPRDVRATIARRLLERAGFEMVPVEGGLPSIDRLAIMARRP